MEAIILEYILGGAVALLGGDRVFQTVRDHRNGNSPATKSDMEALDTKLDDLSNTFSEHLGYHRGLRER